jgi:hypothetical protein
MVDTNSSAAQVTFRSCMEVLDCNDLVKRRNRKICGESSSQCDTQSQHRRMESLPSYSLDDDIRGRSLDEIYGDNQLILCSALDYCIILDRLRSMMLRRTKHTATRLLPDQWHGQPNSDHIAAGGNNTYELGVTSGRKLVLAIPRRWEPDMMCIVTVASNKRRNSLNTRLVLMMEINGSASTTEIDIRLRNVVVNGPGDTKGSLIQYDFRNKIHGQDLKPAARPGQDFLGGLLVPASKERKSTIKDQLHAYTYRSKMEEQEVIRTANRLARCQMELPISRPKDGTGGQSYCL